MFLTVGMKDYREAGKAGYNDPCNGFELEMPIWIHVQLDIDTDSYM